MTVCVPQIVQHQPTHMIDDSLQCAQCPKSFTSTKLLTQHQQMFHTDKAFICETCGKAFRFRSNLAEHRSVHTALKPYVCKFCGKSSRLKGNLTKHILKHHKKEQNEAIGKDDIIIKKAPKPENGPSTSTSTVAKASAASTPSTSAGVLSTSTNNSTNNNNSNSVNHNVKTEIEDPDYVMVSNNANNATIENVEPSFLPKDSTSEQDRSILIHLGFDYGTSLDLNRLAGGDQSIKPEMSSSPENVQSRDEMDYEYVYTSPLAQTTVGGDAGLAALIANCNSGSPNSNSAVPTSTPPLDMTPPPVKETIPSSPATPSTGTQCQECGKHVRKNSYLAVHMSLHHGFPPPDSATSDEKASEDGHSGADDIQSELRAIATAICELKAQQLSTPKIENLLCTIDTRVSRLEKNMDIALNSIYTLVQLQTGMSSSVTRFRDEATSSLSEIRDVLERSGTSP